MAALRFLTGQMDAFEVNDVSAAAAASVSVCRSGDQEDQKHLVEIAQLLHPSESRLHVAVMSFQYPDNAIFAEHNYIRPHSVIYLFFNISTVRCSVCTSPHPEIHRPRTQF